MAETFTSLISKLSDDRQKSIIIPDRLEVDNSENLIESTESFFENIINEFHFDFTNDLFETLKTYCMSSIILSSHHSEYSSYEKRLETFKLNLNNTSIFSPWIFTQSPEEMAQWGFYRRKPYYQQHVVCFHCGVVLSEWSPNDSVVQAHFHFRSNCAFIWLMLLSSISSSTSLSPTSIVNDTEANNDLSILQNLINYFPTSSRFFSSSSPSSSSTSAAVVINQSNDFISFICSRLKQLKWICQLVKQSKEELINYKLDFVIVARDILLFDKNLIAATLCLTIIKSWSTSLSSQTRSNSNRSGSSSRESDDNSTLNILTSTFKKSLTFCEQLISIKTNLENNFCLDILPSLMNSIENVNLDVKFPSSTTVNTTASAVAACSNIASSSTNSDSSEPIKSVYTNCTKCHQVADFLLLPCGHLAFCLNCKNKLEKRQIILSCPRCHEMVHDIVRVYRAT